MDALTRREFETLARHRNTWCVSIYFPTDRGGKGQTQVPIRLKNLSAQAERDLIGHGMRSTEARRLLEPVRELASIEAIIKGISDGMAIFVEPAGLRMYRLPISFDELVTIGNRFHIKPLLPLVVAQGRFLLLAVSPKNVRVFEADRWQIRELELAGVPKNMEDALEYDEPREVRNVQPVGMGRNRTQHGFHNQGGSSDASKDARTEFFRYLDRALRTHWSDERAPLVFAGVDYMFPLFKNTTSYKHVVPESISSNTDGWSPQQLHETAWAIVEPLFTRDRDEAIARAHRVAGTDHGLLQMEMVLQACRLGQVGTLLVDSSQSRWGTFDPEAGTLHLDDEPRPGNEDLLDLAIAWTIDNSGQAYPVDAGELPDNSVMAAVLRYPVPATSNARLEAVAR